MDLNHNELVSNQLRTDLLQHLLSRWVVPFRSPRSWPSDGIETIGGLESLTVEHQHYGKKDLDSRWAVVGLLSREVIG